MNLGHVGVQSPHVGSWLQTQARGLHGVGCNPSCSRIRYSFNAGTVICASSREVNAGSGVSCEEGIGTSTLILLRPPGRTRAVRWGSMDYKVVGPA